MARCIGQVSRLYEQGADAGRIGIYLQRWARWLWAGLGEIVVELESGAQCVVGVVVGGPCRVVRETGAPPPPCSGI